MINIIAQSARDSGVCDTEPDPDPESMLWPTAAIVGAFAAFVVI